MYEYEATVLRAVDGDTLDLEFDLGLEVSITRRVRLAGIDCPELSSPVGQEARTFTLDWLSGHEGPYVVQTEKDRQEKYGRYLVRLLAADRKACLNDDLLTAKLAVAYWGAKRLPAA